MKNAYNLNLYVKGNCSIRTHLYTDLTVFIIILKCIKRNKFDPNEKFVGSLELTSIVVSKNNTTTNKQY